MSQEKLRKVHLIYGIVLSCLIVVMGICFIVSCMLIYRSGARPFTRESISEHFGNIAVPVILCLLGIVGGMVLSFFPLEKPKLKGFIDTDTILNRFTKKYNYAKCHSKTADEIRKEQKKRKTVRLCCVIVNALCLLVSLLYGLNKNNFPAIDINGEMVDSMLFIIPCIVVSLGAIYAGVLICNASTVKELELIKQSLALAKNQKFYRLEAPKLNSVSIYQTKRRKFFLCSFAGNKSELKLTAKTTIQSDEKSQNYQSEKTLLGARLTLLVLATTFIIIGIFNGGMADVLQKAINICTECIGLG